MRKFTYDDFYSSVLELEFMGLGYSMDGDYIPIASFCFTQPLMIVISYKNGTITKEELKPLLIEYFE